MQNKKVLIIGISALVLVGVIVGLIIYNKNKSNNSYGNKAYTDCVNEANRLQEANQAISDQVDADIEKCIGDYIKARGYNDDINCLEDYENPICSPTNGDIGRYNAEVDGNNECNEKREEMLKELGYKEDIVPALDCVKHLGK
jgi:hypothetical protein